MNGYHVPVQVLAKKKHNKPGEDLSDSLQSSREITRYAITYSTVLSAGCLSVILQYRCQLGIVVTDRQKDRQTDWSTTVTLAATVRRGNKIAC